MSKKTVIVDYGLGNIYSVMGALDYLGVKSDVTCEAEEIKHADMLILPGVGSFKTAMRYLEVRGIADALKEAVLIRQTKILGICLGLQLMAEYGDEDGGCSGLGFIQGNVTRFNAKNGLKVPHVGFNQVRFAAQSLLSSGIENEADCYFVHSYRLEIGERLGFSSLCDYGGDFIAAYEYNNIFATQFHPEKSQTTGLKIVANYINA